MICCENKEGKVLQDKEKSFIMKVKKTIQITDIEKCFIFRKEELMSYALLDAVRKRGILLAAHRGVTGGNIPCNSAPAYIAALRQGADIIETDVANTADGGLFIMHPCKENIHVGPKCPLLSTMTTKEVEKLYLANQDITPTQYPILSFYQMMELLRGKGFINIDKFEENPAPISREIRRLDMTEQVIVKGYYNEGMLSVVEEYGADLPFLLITRDPADIDRIKQRKVRFVGVEMLWNEDTDPLVQKDVRESLIRDDKILWGNSIVYDYRVKLSADHTDDIAVTEDPHKGWGWFCDNGFGIIQTDWLAPCDMYLKEAGYRK